MFASKPAFPSNKNDSAEFETELSLSDRLKVFKSSRFEPDAYLTSKCQSMSEKEIKHLCTNLIDLKKASAEEMRKSVYANYGAFIRTSREISDLEGQLLSMRNLLSTQGALVHGLAEGVCVDLRTGQEDATEEDMSNPKEEELPNTEKWIAEFLENLEVLLAERRVDEALAAFEEAEKVKEETCERRTMSRDALLALQTAIKEQRQNFTEQLAEATCQPSTRGAELRSAVLALKKLGDGPRAHTLLLNSHHQKLSCNMQGIRSLNSSCGGVYAGTLSQLVFSTIAQATSDSLAIFGEDPAYTSELVTWAVKESDAFANLLKRHVLASSAASGALRVAAECVHICLGHCSVLEARGLALSPVFLRFFRPYIEQALTTNLKRIEQSSAALAAADDWYLTYAPTAGRSMRVPSATFLSSGTASQPRLSSSAHKFISMVQEFLEDVGPLESLQLEGAALEGLLQVFGSYVNLLIHALPGSAENEDNPEGSTSRIVKMAETEEQQVALLANALLLGDELLPRAAARLLLVNKADDSSRKASDKQSHMPEQREWKRRLQRSVDCLRDIFCRQHALDLIFTEDGDIRLNSHMYTPMDDFPDEPEWSPSPIFQELFVKLTRIQSLAADMFVGRERFATMLLTRFTETVILWLSDDQNFWEEIEQGPKPLGPFGIRQFYLDMQFVVLFSSQGRYLTRNLHQVIKNILARAIEIASAAGMDPYSVLPDEGWFADVSQMTIDILTGKANFGHMEHEATSPTAKSISSVLSHGSN